MLESKIFFRAMNNSLQPAFKTISARTVTRQIMIMLIEEKTKLMEYILSHQINFSITSDIWDTCLVDHYLCITAHFVNNSHICKRIIYFRKFNTLHTGANVASIIHECLKKYNFTNRLISISFDNASNNNNAITRLERMLEPALDVSLFHVKCMCHIINLIA